MRRLLDYYRQFEELSPEEVSRELRERRDAERAQALTEVPPLDLASPAWHEPPDAEAVNAATYALRRAVNAYPDAGAPLREALAARHGVEAEQVVAGHGAGELLRAAFARCSRARRRGRRARGRAGARCRGSSHEAGGAPVPVAGRGAPTSTRWRAAPAHRAVVAVQPERPDRRADRRRAALAERLAEPVVAIVDAALAEFAPDDATSPPCSARASG